MDRVGVTGSRRCRMLGVHLTPDGQSPQSARKVTRRIRPSRRAARPVGTVVPFLAGFATALLLASPTQAVHNVGMKWIDLPSGCYQHFVTWKHRSSVPQGDFRARISDARNKWNAKNTELYFGYTSASNPRIWTGYTHIGWPNEGAFALASWNWIGSKLENGTIDFNSDYDAVSEWYRGTGDAPTSMIDLYSVAIHEFGHLVQLNHVNDTTPPIDVMHAWLGWGEERRFLTNHDGDGIWYLYRTLVC